MQRVVLGPFELRELVGRGGAGVVFRGVHLETGVPVAVKVLHPASLQDGSPPEAFHNEVRAVASLDHPGIIWVFDADVVSEESAAGSGHSLVSGSPYLAMEYASGGTLADWIPPDFSAVEELIEALLLALGHAHARNVVHRDLKPHNVLRGGPGDVRPGWKLTDFGIAANFQQTMERSLAGGIVGTLSYMSPEQIKGEWRRYGAWTDLYALGCVLYKVLVGKRPWESVRGTALLSAHLDRPPEPLKPKVSVPQGFTDWVAVLLEKRPADRFQSAAEALLAFRELGPAPELLSPSLAPSALGEQTEVMGLVDRRRDRVGLPLRWRQHETPWPPPRLVGAGLGLLTLRTWPMVGRIEERDQLWSAVLATVRDQRSRVVMIRGHAGVGKSRLARWVGESASALGGLLFLRSEARPGEPPDVATLAAFRRWLRTERLGDDERLLHLRGLFPDAGIEWLTDLSALVAPGSEGHGRQIQGDARHELLGQLLARMTPRGRPAVLLFDNAHASTDAIRFARYLGHLDVTGGPVALVILVISDESLSLDPHAERLVEQLAGACTLPLGPLPPGALGEIIQTMLPMESTLAAEVADRTGGNPLHAVQVLQGWARQGRLTPGSGGFELDRGRSERDSFDVPSMEAVWLQRLGSILEGLPSEARILLERAATLGPRVDALEWQRVCDDPRGEHAAQGRTALSLERAGLREVLQARLLAARLADETPKGWAFAHEMFRETILGIARAAGRLPSHHRSCARVLLHLWHSHRYAERIGRHLLAGHRPHSAIPQLLEGIRRRRRRSGDAATLPLLREVELALRDAGVPDGDRAWCELAALRGDVFVRLGHSRDAERWGSEVQELARRGGWS
ncbi:MAG TPA: hypothetical protein ENK18_04200, partial [Deltaproteobacteria bacterium]|nr:hypothetical protein [Deltaproteobacteria bacterium]